MTTAIRIGTEPIQRERGYIYYLDKQGYLVRTPTTLNKAGTTQRAGNQRIRPVDGCMYFLDKNGYISAAPIRYSNVDPAAGTYTQRVNKLKESHRAMLRKYGTEGQKTAQNLAEISRELMKLARRVELIGKDKT